MTLSIDELVIRLRSEGEAVEGFFARLTPAHWERPVYHNDGAMWCVRDVLAHFIAAEQSFQELIQNVSDDGQGASEDFEIDAFNKRSIAALVGQDAPVLLGQFAMVRERTAAIVNALRSEQLTKRGRHPYLGVTSLDEMIRAIYHHNSLHLRDVRRALAAAAEQPDGRKPGADGWGNDAGG